MRFFKQSVFWFEKQGKNAKAYPIQKAAYYLSENQITRRIIEKKWQKMLAGIRKKPTFAPQFNAEERWVSGWNQQFAKLSYPAMGTGGSNPPFSAKEGRRWRIVFFFGVWRSPASAPALGAGGRRFESFCPDLKIKGLQAIVTPIFSSF